MPPKTPLSDKLHPRLHQELATASFQPEDFTPPFRGRCPLHQYIKSMPGIYGIKVIALMDARVCYVIYAGKQPPGPFKVDNKPHQVVLRLTSPISGTGHNITMDNWFISVPLEVT